MSAEVTSSYPVDENSDDLELGLGLSIGGGGGGLKSKAVVGGPCWGQYARILTAKDFPSLVSKPNSSSSSSSVNIPNSSTSGTKRTAADSVSPPNGTRYTISSTIFLFYFQFYTKPTKTHFNLNFFSTHVLASFSDFCYELCN